MIFQEILRQNKWEDIHNCLLKDYPRQRKNLKNYKVVFANLLSMQPDMTDSTLMIIDVSTEEGQLNVDVFMLEKEDDQEQPTDYALTNLPWAKVIGLTIDEKSDKTVPEVDAIAYALFKMTEIGYTKQRPKLKYYRCIYLKRKLKNKYRKNLKLCIYKFPFDFRWWLTEGIDTP